jgi:hypothetical protein
MNCQACGAEAPAEGDYCRRCGRKIDESAPDPADTAQAQPQEIDLWQGAYSSRAMIPGGIVLGLLSLASLAFALGAADALPRGSAFWGAWLAVMLALWSYCGFVGLHRRWGNRYRLTSQRFFQELGAFLRSTNCIDLADVDAVEAVQSLPQWLLGVGTIYILTHDISHPKLILRGIADVHRVAALLEKARREADSQPPSDSPSPSGRG